MSTKDANRWTSSWVSAAFALLAFPVSATAGMPSITFHDVMKMRLEAVSFFLVVLLISAAVVYFIWNKLCSEFVWLPRLSYGKACGVVTLWGLLFVVVLTMISGARELMTPGAWERDGWTYSLSERGAEAVESQRDFRERKERLTKLAGALMGYAQGHAGKYPDEEQIDQIPSDLLTLPEHSGLKYVYVFGRSRSDYPRLLAYEPRASGDLSLALFTDGVIRSLQMEEIYELREFESR